MNIKGRTPRQPRQQVELACRMIEQRHHGDVSQRARDHLGDRYMTIGRPDISRNLLSWHCRRLGVAYHVPPLVDGLSESLARLVGDYSASVTVARYGQAGGRPMPTELVRASERALQYRLGAGYAGVLVDWSTRSRRVALRTIAPAELELTYASDDPTEPTCIRHYGARIIASQLRDVVDVYDLTDLKSPAYRVESREGADLTFDALGESLSGDSYPWRWADGTPYHRIVVTGHSADIYATEPLVEGTLNSSVKWTAHMAAITDAGFPQRNVRGMNLASKSSDADSGRAGVEAGPERVLVWVDEDPERPGTHWQDGPGYDPEIMGRAIRDYDMALLSQLGLPVSHESTGGDPTESEQRALAVVVARTYPDCRRLDSEILRRCAAMLNRLPAEVVPGDSFDESEYGILYREEVTAALAATETQEHDNGRPGPGRSGRETVGTDQEGEE